MAIGLKYDIELSENIDSIIEQDIFVGENITGMMLTALSDPMKFFSSTSIFLKEGECSCDVNLVSHRLKAPCLLNVRSNSILQPTYVSPDFKACFVVLSQRLTDNIFMFLDTASVYSTLSRNPVVAVPDNLVGRFERFYEELREVKKDVSNPYATQNLIFTIVSFFYRTAYKCYENLSSEMSGPAGRITEHFLSLVQQNFKTARNLEFYGNKLGICSKHLSRTVKAQTGYTAVEWIERYVTLEAKVMLKSSNLNIQQISDELNFPSQSFFGKYFKKRVGVSPKEFRNRR